MSAAPPVPVGAGAAGELADLRERLIALCTIPSVTRSERALVEHLRAQLEALGASEREDDAGRELGGDAGNLIAELAGGRAERVMLNAHVDTVPLVPGVPLAPIAVAADDSAGEAVIVRCRERQVLGSDDKAGVAIVMALLERAAATPFARRPTLVAVFTVGEEGGLAGAQALDVAALRADLGFVFDGEVPVGEVIAAAVYKEALRLRVRGRRAHAALEPERGVHAIAAAAAVVAGFPLGRHGDVVANLGRIEGGGASNVIPDEVIVHGEARAFEAAALEALLERIASGARQAAESLGATVTLEHQRLYDGYDLPESALPFAWLRAAAPAHGLEVRKVRSIGGSDTNVFNQRGVSTVNVGIGMHDIHSVDEWIDVRDLVTVTAWLSDALGLTGPSPA